MLAPDADKDPAPTAAGLQRALAVPLRDPRLGVRVSSSVVDAETGQPLLAQHATRAATPASVTKVATAIAALQAVGGRARIATRVVAGAAPGEVVLIGGGDPTLSVGARQAYPGAARLDVLAAAVRRTFAAPVRRVTVDSTAFTGRSFGPGWDDDLLSNGHVAPITAVMVDGGRLDPMRRARTPTPDLTAGRALGRLLGVPASAVTRGQAPAGAREVGRISSAPIATLVEQMLQHSDNVLAEALGRQVAIAKRARPDFAGTAAAVGATLRSLGVDLTGWRLVDASGLSRLNLATATAVTALLAAAANERHPQLRAALTGLPVAAFSGTLLRRFRAGPARLAAGEVRAKTGSLSGVSSLAGVVRDADGRLLAFAVLADRVPPGGTLPAEAALDAVAATLSRCGCR